MKPGVWFGLVIACFWAVSTISVARAETTPAQIEKGCAAYGDIGAEIVRDRNRGVSLPDVMAGYQKNVPPSMLGSVAEMAGYFYQHPLGKTLSAQAAQDVMLDDCRTKILKSQAGGRLWRDQQSIGEALASYATFDRTPLKSLFESFGIEFESVELIPAVALPDSNLQPGDVLYVITFARGPKKPMPCGLNRWFKGDSIPAAEAVKRKGAFPVVELGMGPALYWAVTGKCSDQFKY